MNSDFFLNDKELSDLLLEIESIESDIQCSIDELSTDAKIQRLDEIISVIEASKRNLSQNQVVRLF